MRVTIKGVHRVRVRLASGAVETYYYHRPSKTRIHEKPNTAAFVAFVAAAEKAWRDGIGSSKSRGTVAELIAAYKRSRAYTGLADRTRADYLKQIALIEAKFGRTPIAVFDDRRIRGDVIEWRDALAANSPKQADYALTVFVRILNVAYDQGRIRQNHIAGIDRVYQADRSDRIWLPEHVAAFNKAARPVLQQALMLALHTGQRQGDLLRLPWSAYDGQRLTMRQSKGGKWVEIRCTAALKHMLDRMKPLAKGTVILTNARGAGWKPNAFRLAWGRAFDAAGLSGLTFHDLRGTAVTMLAEAGCTVPEIAAITGHSLKGADAILERYLSRTRGLALAGILKLDAAPRRA